MDKGILEYDPPGTSIPFWFPSNSKNAEIVVGSSTELNLINKMNRVNFENAKNNITQNLSNSEDMMMLAKRMEANQNGSNYLKSA